METEKFNDLNVLIVDDDQMVRDVIREMLISLNFKSVQEAGDGIEGVNIVRTAEHPIDLVLLDLNMPNLDGFGFIEKIRNDKSDDIRNLPIVVLTANAVSENVSRAVELGINGFIDKPVSIDVLSKQIEKGLMGKPIGTM